MEKSSEKHLSVSSRSCNLLSKAVKRVHKFQQTCEPETFSNVDFVSEINLVVTSKTNFQNEISRPKYNEADHLKSALNNHIQSLEKLLDEKQTIIETLLQNIQSCSYNNTVANGNHKVGKVSFGNLNSPDEKNKMISNKSNQVDDDDNRNNNNYQKTSSETKDQQSLTLDKRIDKSNPTTVGDKVTEKKTNKQIIKSSRHHLDKKNDVRPTEKNKS